MKAFREESRLVLPSTDGNALLSESANPQGYAKQIKKIAVGFIKRIALKSV